MVNVAVLGATGLVGREMLATLDAPVFIARQSLLSAKDILKAKRAVKRAFELQPKGFTFVELVGNCPTNWGLAPVESTEWARQNMLSVFPVGVFRDREKEAESARQGEPPQVAVGREWATLDVLLEIDVVLAPNLHL